MAWLHHLFTNNSDGLGESSRAYPEVTGTSLWDDTIAERGKVKKPALCAARSEPLHVAIAQNRQQQWKEYRRARGLDGKHTQSTTVVW